MSRKQRVLVEGKHDKSHFNNLLRTVLGENKIKVDTAELIRGGCKETARNNRAKIDKIFNLCSGSNGCNNLYFLCDREFLQFEIGDVIVDCMREHKHTGHMFWTLGHSFENYFFDKDVILDAYRYLTASEHKELAARLFSEAYTGLLRIVSAASLAAKEIDKSTYPGGVIRWEDFQIIDGQLSFPIETWRETDSSDINLGFVENYKKYYSKLMLTEDVVCLRICRGHTAMQLIQRAFAFCIYQAGQDDDEESAMRQAEHFAKIKEYLLASALCEAWLRSIKKGNDNYPVKLIKCVA